AAPIWRFAGPSLAYHLVQVENAIVASLAAIPLYILARQLRLSRGWALASAMYGLLLPELVLVAYVSSDALGYTLALAAIASGVSALDRPTTRSQLLFLTFATLAALTRVEYVVLALAYVAAAIFIDRRRATKHGVAALSILPAVAITLFGAFGYYLTDESGRSVPGWNYFTWLYTQPYLCALILGVAIVPGAVAGLISVRSRAAQAFAAFTAAMTALLLIESTKVAAAKFEFKERYLFVIFALVPIAFGLYISQGRPRRRLVLLLAAVIGVAAARLPVSEYTQGSFKTDS